MAAKKDFIIVDGIVCTTSAPLMDIDLIKPYEGNAKLHGSELEYLKNAIKDPQIGFCDPIEVDRDMVIVSGHGRRQAALELGMTKVPVLVHEHMHGAASDAYRLIANRTSDLSDYNWDAMNLEISKLEDSGWDMGRFSFEPPQPFEPEPEPFEGGFEDIVTEAPEDGGAPADTTYRIMVYPASQAEQMELHKELVERGYDCQMIDRGGKRAGPFNPPGRPRGQESGIPPRMPRGLNLGGLAHALFVIYHTIFKLSKNHYIP